MILYKYIFYKVYFFYLNVFKEKEIPHWFAAGVLATVIILNYYVLIDAYFYYYHLEKIRFFTSYDKYFGVLLGIFLMWYVSKNNKYLDINKECKELPKRKQKVLGYICVTYVALVVIGFIWIGELIRLYNMS